MLILSGGYGVLLADEPIGFYEARFDPAWWPKGLLEDVLVAYASRHRLKRVLAVVSLTTAYRKVVAGAQWSHAGVTDAWLLAPEAVTGGAMVKSPRAQGEAIAALLRGDLTGQWRSSDGLEIYAVPLA